MVITIIVAVLIVLTFIGHLIKPDWMSPTREIVFCVVIAILVLVASACLAARIKESIDVLKKFGIKAEREQQIAACVLGFIAMVLLIVECIILGVTGNLFSA